MVTWNVWGIATHTILFIQGEMWICWFVGVHLTAIAARPSLPFVASRCLLGWPSEPDYRSLLPLINPWLTDHLASLWATVYKNSPSSLSLHIVLTTSPLACGLYIVVTHYFVSHQMYKNCTEGQRPSLPSLGRLHHASMCDSLWRGSCCVYGSASLGWQLSTASGDVYGLVFSECHVSYECDMYIHQQKPPLKMYVCLASNLYNVIL